MEICRGKHEGTQTEATEVVGDEVMMCSKTRATAGNGNGRQELAKSCPEQAGTVGHPSSILSPRPSWLFSPHFPTGSLMSSYCNSRGAGWGFWPREMLSRPASALATG